MNLKAVRIILWSLIVVAVFGIGGLVLGQYFADRAGNPSANAVEIGGPFTLTGTDGEPVSSADLAGKPRAMFFGFTHCPDICPTTLFEAAGWLEALGPAADDLNVLFVTVDPERDTPEVMEEYVGAFDDRIIGLTGDPETIDAVVKDYRVYARKVPLDEGGYTMDHSASVLLFDGDGNFHGFISYNDDQETALNKLRGLLDAG